MRVLVTGGAGFLGKALAQRLLQRGDEIIIFDTSLSGLDNLHSAFGHRLEVVAGSITDMAALALAFKAHRPDAVVHCAAVVGMLASPMTAMRVNVEGSVNVLDAMRLFETRRCIHISSEETYGNFQAATIDEEHPQRPVTAYGVSKLAVEHLSRTYNVLHGLEVIHLRTSWVYGAGLLRHRVPKNLIDAALSGQPLHIPHGGDSAIDHTHIDDFVSGVALALDHADHPYDAYHIASGTSLTLHEMVDAIKGIVPGADISVGPGPYRYLGELEICRKGALDISRANRVFGYVPRLSFAAGAREYVDRSISGRCVPESRHAATA
ncbi:MAG: SDR family NAD(P)-dependent oxidoreductase [Hyphomicrobiaceae bacterium]|nr:SDR family NAD(P)-dependent oxidoreductase [Hyphomicrobiaceae bacterium]